ncbi:uncharacterized protein TOT_030000482 [Theileria orientalis strain Shintoku]|uniref:Uncharacterized protein n=1 Tax=Theileria orientalis strain Shintoku TaxID=869250 RepID=J4DPS6_THEOR|nr:uncharacterized protein TOT_030000482 [Theileria orientalis strain Shintoku]BAM41219.1 uncharacterized protein TOT_030000482 [Theileria orientalis strain Shintoku]|eukprot:XP_009691520.1 uncharacterized protein TOT_030000482 [Theileria orientalis strain Shintoku]
MNTIKSGSLIHENDARSINETELSHAGSRARSVQAKPPLRVRLIEKATAYSKSTSYRRHVYSKYTSDKMYRNVERDEIQGEANRALMRKDCFQANYNDYIPSSFDKVYDRDRLINIPFDDIDAIGRLQPNQEKMLSISNFRTPFEYLTSSMSFGALSLNKSFIKSNITLTASNQFSIGSSGINQASIGSSMSNQMPINQSSIGSGAGTQMPINQLSLAGINQSSIGSKSENVIVDLIKNGMSPGEVAKLSDVFQYPSCFRKVTGSIIPWLQRQLRLGYWNNNSSLFILCLTMALSVGSVETIFKLNSTWGGLIFLFTYLVAFLFIVQPMFCLELGLGQLFRCSPFEIFDKLVPGMGGVGVAMVILCLLSACIASSRTCSEYLIYLSNVFREKMVWTLSELDVERCESLGKNVLECTKLNPLCYIVEGQCRANRLGKAYLAYQDLFDNPDVDLGYVDYKLVVGTAVTYFLVFTLQMIGLTNFTFFAFILVVVIFFLSHAQVYFSTLLEGSTSYFFDSITKMDLKMLYKNSRLWSHSVRCCIYEYVIGNGIYSTLASKSRIGYDLSSEALGVGILSGYVTSLQFFSALALVGYFCLRMGKVPEDILWMLEQDSSFVLLPMGFIATHNMERTLLVLQFCSCFILITFTLSIQIEVIMTTLTRFVKVRKVYVAAAISSIMVLACVPLCSRGGKRIIWFLEIAVGDLGRVFMVLMTCIVIGWFYGSEEQIKKVGRLPLYVFNATFWVGNVAASLGELLDETLPLYVMWLFRVLGILLAVLLSTLTYLLRPPKSTAADYANKDQAEYTVDNSYTLNSPFASIKENYDAALLKEYEKRKASEAYEGSGKPAIPEFGYRSVKSGPTSKAGSPRNLVIASHIGSIGPEQTYVKTYEGYENRDAGSAAGDNFEQMGNAASVGNPDNVNKETQENLRQLRRERRKQRTRELGELMLTLFIGNIEVFRREFGRISPMNKTHNICWSVVWSISIKWVSCCLLSNALADILEEILSAERVERNIHTIPTKFKVLTIVIWLLLILIIALYPLLKKFIYKKRKLEVIDLYELPSCPREMTRFKFKIGYLFRELY